MWLKLSIDRKKQCWKCSCPPPFKLLDIIAIRKICTGHVHTTPKLNCMGYAQFTKFYFAKQTIHQIFLPPKFPSIRYQVVLIITVYYIYGCKDYCNRSLKKTSDDHRIYNPQAISMYKCSALLLQSSGIWSLTFWNFKYVHLYYHIAWYI